MLDMKFVRTNPELVKENIRKKFQDEKLELVDKVIELDEQCRKAKGEGDELRNVKNKKSKEFGRFNGMLKKAEDDNAKAEAEENIARITAEVKAIDEKIEKLEKIEAELNEKIREIMLVIPNIIDESVPIGRNDSEIRRTLCA